MRSLSYWVIVTGVAGAVIAVSPLHAQTTSDANSSASPASSEETRSSATSDWPFAGADIADTHTSSTEHLLGPDTVPSLTRAWVFSTGGDVQSTPTVEGNDVYVTDQVGNLYRIDARTGSAVWSHSLADYTGHPQSSSRNSPAIGAEAVIIGDQASGTVIAVDKSNGHMIWKTLVDPHPAALITASPVIAGDRVYIGVASGEEGLASMDPNYQLSFRGRAVALDLNTGKIVWTFSTVPSGYTGGAVWGSTMAVDPKRGSLYVGTGNNYSVPPSVSKCLRAATNAKAQSNCLAPGDHIDSVLSIDLTTGRLKWARKFIGFDTYTNSCLPDMSKGIPCPDPSGPDYDFGSGPNLYTTSIDGKPHDLLGAGQKSGVYWALNPDNGSIIWATQVGPGGLDGGIEWGTASDGRYVYVAVSNTSNRPYKLQPSGRTWNAGSWTALDAATGKFVWQVPVTGKNPKNTSLGANGFTGVSAANGVMYSSSNSGYMAALKADDGTILWQYPSGGSVIAGPAVVNGTVYWGSGDRTGGQAGTVPTISNHQLYAFKLPNTAGNR